MDRNASAPLTLILGLGISGLAMARWCARIGHRVRVADTREAPPALAALQAELPAAEFIAGPLQASLLTNEVGHVVVSAVYCSPGLAPDSVAEVRAAAQQAGVFFGGELDLFTRQLAALRDAYGYRPYVLAITGTNGKTTVTALTGHLLARAGLRVAVAGNIGPSLLDTLAIHLQTAQAAVDALDTAAAAAQETAPAGAALSASDRSSTDAGDAPLDATPTASEDTAEVLQDAAAPEVDETPPPTLGLPPPDPRQSTFAAHMPQAWVLELSSFQLEYSSGFEPTAGVMLNVSQDHLDWHGSMDAYIAAKAKVFGRDAVALVNRDDAANCAWLPQLTTPAKPAGRTPRGAPRPASRRIIPFGLFTPTEADEWGVEQVAGMPWLARSMGDAPVATSGRRRSQAAEVFLQRLMPADAMRIRGSHNISNALAALALASTTGAGLAPMLHGLREYRGEPHRVQSIGMVRGVEYIDDSKGTNVGATVAALRGLGGRRKLVVILGGDGKGQEFAPLAEPVAEVARAVVLIGRDAPVIAAALAETGVPLQQSESLEAAVEQAAALAQEGDAVLLSPACASLDMFRNYAHRAEVFVDSVRALALDAGQELEVWT